MSALWKGLIALVVAVPLGAYAAGSLVASAEDPPPTRAAIELRDVGDNGQAADDVRRRDRQDRSGEDDDDAEVEFGRVNPDPEELDKDAEDAAEERRDRLEDRRDDRRDRREDRRDDRDDNSGHGSGDDGGDDDSGRGSDDD